MKTCQFIPKDNKYICENCEYITKYSTLKRECIPLQVPSIGQRLNNFGKALNEHIKMGQPVVNQEEVNNRLKHCHQCPLFKFNNNMVGGICTHNSCGCNITDTVEFFNKLAWADQSCPIGKW